VNKETLYCIVCWSQSPPRCPILLGMSTTSDGVLGFYGFLRVSLGSRFTLRNLRNFFSLLVIVALVVSTVYRAGCVYTCAPTVQLLLSYCWLLLHIINININTVKQHFFTVATLTLIQQKNVKASCNDCIGSTSKSLAVLVVAEIGTASTTTTIL